MRKFLVVAFLIIVMVGRLAAQVTKNELESLGNVSIGGGIGVSVHASESTGNVLADSKLFCLGMRIGVFGTVRVGLTDTFSVGAEVGFAYMGLPFFFMEPPFVDGIETIPGHPASEPAFMKARPPSGIGTLVSFYDVPMNAFMRLKLGPIGLQLYGGRLIAGRNKIHLFNLHVGAKVLFGGHLIDDGGSFIDFSFIIPTDPTDLSGFNIDAAHFRFGSGWQIGRRI